MYLNIKSLHLNGILLFLLFGSIHHGYSSVDPNKTNYFQYTQWDGLPSSEIYDIIQDERGFIWFATDRGLARYDG